MSVISSLRLMSAACVDAKRELQGGFAISILAGIARYAPEPQTLDQLLAMDRYENYNWQYANGKQALDAYTANYKNKI